MDAKKKALFMWLIFVVCVIAAITLRYISDQNQVQYEEVPATVLSAQTKKTKNLSTGSTYTSYEVFVEYEGEEYELKNAHSAYEYPTGKKITAYLSHGSLYANPEGVQSSTPIFYAYFAFLVGSFVMLGVAINATVQSKVKKS